MCIELDIKNSGLFDSKFGKQTKKINEVLNVNSSVIIDFYQLMIVNSGAYPKVSLSYFCNVLIELDLFTEKQLSLLKNDDEDLDRSQFL